MVSVPKRLTRGVITAIAVIAVVVFILARMKTNTQQPNLSEKCVQALAAVARSSAPALVTSGDRIEIGSTKVRLHAHVENEDSVDNPRGYLIGVAVDVFVNDAFQPLTYGSVGVGRDRDDALQTAVRDWAMYVGQALLGALGVRIGEEPQKIGSFLVYEGPIGIRKGEGSPFVPLSKEQEKQLLERLDPFIRGMEHSPGALNSISVMVMVHDGTNEGECRLDGHISPELLKAIQSFSWSEHGADYVFKRFYVLRRT